LLSKSKATGVFECSFSPESFGFSDKCNRAEGALTRQTRCSQQAGEHAFGGIEVFQMVLQNAMPDAAIDLEIVN
jgi:hypothetical protein